MKILLCYSFLLVTAFKSNGQNLLLETTFENVQDIKKWKTELPYSKSFSLSDSFARKGTYSGRFEIGKEDTMIFKGVRAELALSSETENERWYGASILFPESFIVDSVPEVVLQWHSVPDVYNGPISPPVALWIQNNRYKVVMQWASFSGATNKTVEGRKEFDLGEVNAGAWTDWVFHIKYSWQNDGVLEVWKNKTKVISYFGPNSYNDKKLPYFKMGIYKWEWNNSRGKLRSPGATRVAYYDEIRVGNKAATLASVSPK